MAKLTTKLTVIAVFGALCFIGALESGVFMTVFHVSQWTDVKMNTSSRLMLYSNTVLIRESQVPSYQKYEECKAPITKVVFLKTYKTGSTTVSSILSRFGLGHNLSFVIPAQHHPGYFSRTERFNSEMETQLLPPLPGSRYSMLVSHVPFNKTAINNVIPNATFITILRHPVAAYESIFGFAAIADHLHMNYTSNEDPFEMFLSNTDFYMNRTKSLYYRTLLRNRQIFDVGLDPKNYDNETLVEHVIQQATNDFDLVMITEYFDESLILLKQLLCWEFEDILYVHQNARKNRPRFKIDDWKRQRIFEINSADYKLYQHFNKTFWHKVRAYGDSFYDDLVTFRGMLQKVPLECLDNGGSVNENKHPVNKTRVKDIAHSYCTNIKTWNFDEMEARQQTKGRNTKRHVP
ncbi:galactosylceramide sulfotransferase-like [Saccoglossus kowalevskii]|uniref:Galactosylceramide sulfotransferase-like n=1 Tax=Saccoglossus kowalevskii TaxID=10224 RepID=A0ABM0H1F4_SACKO|nr:PREDICTED: galactosylceramide sulfotransferase-like [Saccoglossus kowalevskii]